MKKRKLEAKGRVFPEKWEDTDILTKRVIKLFASFAVKWDQLQNNAISFGIKKYIKKQQVADIPHIGTSRSHLWFRIMDTHHGRGKSISSI